MNKRFRKYHGFLLATCLFSSAAFAEQSHALSPEKVRVVRRISEYWKEGDYKRAKKQILEFLEENPETVVNDHLYAMLGDVYLLENAYPQAILSYRKIYGPEFQNKVFTNLLHCYLEQKEYQEVTRLVEEKEQSLTDSQVFSPEVKLIYATALFRLGVSLPESEKNTLLTKAKKEYEQLLEGEYKQQALFPLAEICQLLQDFDQASFFYNELARENPQHKESHLMTAACLTMSSDKGKAIEKFEEIYQMNGSHAPKAAYNQMVLLFQEERYEEFLAKQDTFAHFLGTDKKPVLPFLLGRIAYQQGRYTDAIEHLQTYFKDANIRDARYKTAILTVLSAAEKTKNLELFDSLAAQMQPSIQNEKEYEPLLVAHAGLCIEKEATDKLQADLNELKERFPQNTSRETLLFDLAVLLSKKEDWQKSRESFSLFVQEFPESSLVEKAALYKMNCSLRELEKTSPENITLVKKSLATDLVDILQKNTLKEEQREEYTLALAKTLYDLQEYEQAAKYMENYISLFGENTPPSEGLVLLSLAYQKSSSLEQFTLAAEKTLSLYPELDEKDFLHLELYNTYIALGETNEENEKRGFFEKAADHLYSVFASDKAKIKLDNQLWLANYLSTKAQESHLASDLEKATGVFTSILVENENLLIDQNTVFLEAEALKLCKLFDLQKNTSAKIDLLEKLYLLQTQENTLPWKFQRLTVFELASAYKKTGNTEKATELYDYLIQTSSHVPSYHGYAALLEKCKLAYSSLNQEDLQTEEKVSSILDNLKDLQINKKLQSEPLHLEAALDYASVRTLLASPDAKESTELFYLKRIREDFSEKEGDQLSEYHKAKSLFPEKEEIYQAYMQYIDALIAKSEAQLAMKASETEKATELLQKAQTNLDLLDKKKELLPDYLQNRITQATSQKDL